MRYSYRRPPKMSEVDRFMAKVLPEPMSGCWLWLGARDQDQQGEFWLYGREVSARQAGLLLLREVSLVAGQAACAVCLNSSCVNPAHAVVMDSHRPLRTTAVQRFMAFVVVDASGCWLWSGGRTKEGYGRFWLGGRSMGAHRAALILFRGIDPGEEFGLHSCDAPACANPDHVRAGTQKDNIQDALVRGRRERVRPPVRRGEQNNKAKVTATDVIAIRLAFAEGVTKRTLAARYGITMSSVKLIVNRHTWQHVA